MPKKKILSNRKRKCVCGWNQYKILMSDIWRKDNTLFHFTIFECLRCHLLRTIPIPQNTTTRGQVKERLAKLGLWELFAKNIIKQIEKYKKEKELRVLDIGANLGVFVNLSAKKGWDVTGIDVDREVVRIGKEKFKIDLRCTDLEDAKFKSEEFDVVTLSHTLEHILEPKELLMEIHRVLKERGILVIEVPNIDGFPVKIQNIRGELWYGYDPRHHIWHFTPKTLRRLLEDLDFDILELNTSQPLYYEKTGSFTDIPRDLILKLSGLLGVADQIILVATPQK